jgi:hypothetical protein
MRPKESHPGTAEMLGGKSPPAVQCSNALPNAKGSRHISKILRTRAGGDPGCVKTPTLSLRVEFLSQFRRCGNRLHRRLLLGEDN